jgi:hypothetical protein
VGADESLATVQRLLGMLPEVGVAWVQHGSAVFRLGLEVHSPRSLALLAHVALAANVTLAVEVAWGWAGPADDPACLRYDLRVPSRAAGRRMAGAAYKAANRGLLRGAPPPGHGALGAARG